MKCRKFKKGKKNKKALCAKAQVSTGVLRQSGGVLLISAAYQIFSVGMISASPPEPLATSTHQKTSLGVSVAQPAPFLIADNIPGKCVGGPIGPSGGSSGGGGGWCLGCKGSTGPTAAEMASQQAHSLNEQGIIYYNSKNWKQAEQAFRAALEKTPYDQVIRHNLGNTIAAQGVEYYNNKDWKTAMEFFRAALELWPDSSIFQNNYKSASDNLASEEAKKKRQQEEALAADKMRQMLLQSADKVWQAPPPTSSGLDFAGRKGASEDHAAPAAASGGLDFMRPGEKVSPAGKSSANPSASESQGRTGISTSGSTKAGDQLKSAASSDNLTKNYDAGGAKAAGHLDPVTIEGRGPLYPADMGNPRMAKAQQELTKLQSQGGQLRAKLDKLVEARNHTKDPAQMKELSAQVDLAQKEYGGNQFDISKKKDEVVKIHRSIESDREPAAPPSGASQQDNKPGKNGANNAEP